MKWTCKDQRKQWIWNKCSPITEALNEGTSQWLKAPSTCKPNILWMNDIEWYDKTIELLNEGQTNGIAWKKIYERQDDDATSEWTGNKGI